MAQAMNPVPSPAYYSFSVVGGILRDDIGVSRWQPQNPFYDPGPPPPPKEPKNPDKTNKHQGNSAALQRSSSGIIQRSTHRPSFPISSIAVTGGPAIPVASSRLPFCDDQYPVDTRARHHTESGGAHITRPGADLRSARTPTLLDQAPQITSSPAVYARPDYQAATPLQVPVGAIVAEAALLIEVDMGLGVAVAVMVVGVTDPPSQTLTTIKV
ncbi:hypothetical protein PAXRUDRAFT_11336 [Paxillus rubicundulus Ve08.2h10]|uniref:Uncharacterized protein n=1 Tax=Paxillus rubicundulus Ve08.2h10 TaxID=930991 RepID=A0A0D0DE05_9AGAM|nr:hypothetical protein PAXRUDRAFT_11336 [Paxillus rubicundulus Ve08.2h10]